MDIPTIQHSLCQQLHSSFQAVRKIKNHLRSWPVIPYLQMHIFILKKQTERRKTETQFATLIPPGSIGVLRRRPRQSVETRHCGDQ